MQIQAQTTTPGRHLARGTAPARRTAPAVRAGLLLLLLVPGAAVAQPVPAPPAAGAVAAADAGRDATLRILARRLEDGRFDAARERLEEVARVNPASGLPCFYLGAIAEGAGRWEEASGWYRRCLDREPQAREAADAREALNRVQSYAELDRTAPGRSRRDALLALGRARVLLAGRQEGAARAELEQAVRLDPACWQAQGLAGALCLQAGDPAGAETALLAALEHAPESERTAISSALEQARREARYRKQVESARRALTTHEFARAAEEFSSAWLLFPERGEAGVAAATARALAGDRSGSRELLDLLQRSPHAPVQSMARAARADLAPLLEGP